MVNVLWLKMARELWQRKGSLASLAAITAMGICLFLAMASNLRDLDRARAHFYSSCQLADFSLSMKRAPNWALQTLAEVDNVRAVRGRVNLPIRLQLTGVDEPLQGTALSLPQVRQPIINDIVLRRGTYFTGRSQEEVLLNDAFARARGLQPGQRLQAVIQGGEYNLLVVGTVMSPEFVYAVPAGGGFTPDPSRSPVLWLPERFLQQAAGLDGAFNEVVAMANDPSPAAVRLTLTQVERRLDSYGVQLAIPQEEQSSVHFLANELKELRVNSIFLPSICLGVVALVLNVVMSRLVASQRGVVGTLRALGYSAWSLRFHYLGYGFVVGLGGGLAGLALGWQMQKALMGVYRQYFEIPDMQATFNLDLIAIGLSLSLFFALAGAALGVRGALRLEPAEAMRPPPPEQVKAIWMERIPLLWKHLGFQLRMIFRSIFRNPFRSAVTMGASFVATCLLVETLCMLNAVNYLVDFTFRRTSFQDVTVALREPIEVAAAREVAALGQSGRVEAELSVPCDISRGAASKRVGVTGLGPGFRLQRPLDVSGQPVKIPPEGLVLSKKLAEILQVRPGLTVRLKPLLATRQVVEVPVVAVVDSYLGLSAYADRSYLSRLLGEVDVANTLQLNTFHGPPSAQLLAELRRRPGVLGIEQRSRALEQIEKLLNQSIGTSLGILVFFCGGLAFGSVLNTALVSLGEREREVGTLRVLGYTNQEVWLIFSGESFLVNGLGVFAGLFGGIAFARLISHAYNTELFRLPVIIDATTLLAAATLMLFFIGLAQLVVYYLVIRMHWLDVFKVRE